MEILIIKNELFSLLEGEKCKGKVFFCQTLGAYRGVFMKSIYSYTTRYPLSIDHSRRDAIECNHNEKNDWAQWSSTVIIVQAQRSSHTFFRI